MFSKHFLYTIYHFTNHLLYSLFYTFIYLTITNLDRSFVLFDKFTVGLIREIELTNIRFDFFRFNLLKKLSTE